MEEIILTMAEVKYLVSLIEYCITVPQTSRAKHVQLIIAVRELRERIKDANTNTQALLKEKELHSQDTQARGLWYSPAYYSQSYRHKQGVCVSCIGRSEKEQSSSRPYKSGHDYIK